MIAKTPPVGAAASDKCEVLALLQNRRMPDEAVTMRRSGFTRGAAVVLLPAAGSDGRAQQPPASFVADALHSVPNGKTGIWSDGGGCPDMSAIAETPAVDVATAIQPAFNAACIGCHARGATNSGGLDLTAVASLGATVDAPSDRASGVRRVAPGIPTRSFLFETIACGNP